MEVLLPLYRMCEHRMSSLVVASLHNDAEVVPVNERLIIAAHIGMLD